MRPGDSWVSQAAKKKLAAAGSLPTRMSAGLGEQIERFVD